MNELHEICGQISVVSQIYVVNTEHSVKCAGEMLLNSVKFN